MHEVGAIFAELGISQYLNDFLEQGFDTWETILDITESDFDALKVKLGHRRKLQRRIAETRRLSSADDAAASPKRYTPSEDRQPDEHRILATREDVKDKDKDAASASGTQGGKRKYRRHPKPDEHAPERPPSAYVLFSNKMRDDLKGRHLSFTEIAKLVGENWQNLPPSEKEPYEAQAFADKERYNQELAEYKKTENYRNYNQYLADFKAKQASQQGAASEGHKRPKLEPSRSSGSGSNSEISSQQGGGGGDYSTRNRIDSISSTSTVINGTSWSASAPHASPLGQLSQMPKLRLNNTNSVSEQPKSGQSSPPSTSPHPNSNMTLPGYRESMHPQGLPWRDAPREYEMAPVASRLPPRVTSNTRRSYPVETPNYPLQSPHGMAQSPSAPPLLSHESTSGTSGTSATSRSSLSSASTNSSMYFQPRTPIGPLEPQIDRSQMPLPSLFPTKGGFYEGNQLPPLRPPSSSPHNSLDTGFQTTMVSNVDYPMSAGHGMRTYQKHSRSGSLSGSSTTPTSNAPQAQLSQQGHAVGAQHDSQSSNFQAGFQSGQHPHGNLDRRGFESEKEMDPMSALVRAGEIVSANTSRDRQQ